MHKHMAVGAFALALGACASHTGVVPTGGGDFIIASQAATGLSGLGNLKAEQLREAAAHCERLGQGFEVLESKETQPPYVFGNYPRSEIRFRCAKR